MYEIAPEDFKAIRINEANMTQEKFGEILGAQKNSVQKWEAGDSLPSLKVLCKMCIEFNIGFELGPNVKHPLLQERVQQS